MNDVEKCLRQDIEDTYYEFKDVRKAKDYNTGWVCGVSVYNKKVDDEMSDRLDDYNEKLAERLARREEKQLEKLIRKMLKGTYYNFKGDIDVASDNNHGFLCGIRSGIDVDENDVLIDRLIDYDEKILYKKFLEKREKAFEREKKK